MIHNLKYRPTDSPLKNHPISFEYNNSGLEHDRALLFERYWDYFYVVNIISGELSQIIDLKEAGLRYWGDFRLGNSFIYFNASSSDGLVQIRYDRITEVFERIDKEGVFIGTKIYYQSEEQNAVLYYDLETREEVTVLNSLANIQSIEPLIVSGTNSLLVRDEGGIAIIQDQEVAFQSNCSLHDSLEIFSFYNNKIVCGRQGEDFLDLVSIDLQTCETQIEYNFLVDNRYIQNFKFRELEDRYLLLNYYSDNEYKMKNLVYDLETKIKLDLNFEIFEYDTDKAIRFGPKLYLIGRTDFHSFGRKPEVLEIDLELFSTKKISEFDFFDIQEIVLGNPLENNSASIFYLTEFGSTLFKLNSDNSSLTETQTLNLSKNHGIYYSIDEDLWTHNKYFFSTSEGVYAMENQGVTKILDLNPTANGARLDGFIEHDGFVFALAAIDSAFYSIKINANDLNYTKNYIPNLKYLNGFMSENSENAIINVYNSGLGGSVDQSPGFYDVTTEQYLRFSEIFPDLNTLNSATLSKNNLIISKASGRYIYNTLTKQQTKIDLNSEASIQILMSDDIGGFYFQTEDISDVMTLYYLNPDGDYQEISTGFDFNEFYNGDKTDGLVKSLAFDAEDFMLIFSTNNGEHKIKTLEDYGMLYWMSNSYKWFESDTRSFVEIDNGTSYDLYTFEFDTYPQLISHNVEGRLRAVIEGDDTTVLAFQTKVVNFYTYDAENGTLTFLQEFDINRYSLMKDHFSDLGNSNFLLLLDDGIHGEEPWILNAENGTLELAKDINNHFTSSKLLDFFESPNGDLYFTALTNSGDRQLFIMEYNTTNNVELIEVGLDSDLIVYPNPSTGVIHLAEDYKQVEIFSMNGNLLFKKENYSKGQAIRLSNFNSNLHTLKASSEENKVSVKIFLLNK